MTITSHWDSEFSMKFQCCVLSLFVHNLVFHCFRNCASSMYVTLHGCENLYLREVSCQGPENIKYGACMLAA